MLLSMLKYPHQVKYFKYIYTLVDKGRNRSANQKSDGGNEKVNNLKITKNPPTKQKVCCKYYNGNDPVNYCTCKVKIEAKDEIISVLHNKIENLQNKIRKMETIIKYSKSVDLNHNVLSESIELPKRKSPIRIKSFSPSFVETDINILKDKIVKKGFSSQINDKVSQFSGFSNDRINNNLFPSGSKETKLKKYSLNLSGYNFKMMKPLTSTDNLKPKNTNKKIVEKSLKSNLEYINEPKNDKMSSIRNAPIICTEFLNENLPEEKFLTNDEKNFDGEDFSFHQEDTTKPDLNSQLSLIKLRTQKIINKLSVVNKNLIRRVNSSSTLI